MPAHFETVDSIEQIREFLRNFTAQASMRPELARKVLRKTRYWVWDSRSKSFGPSTFVGQINVNLKDYESGVKFEGPSRRKRIADLIGKSFTPSESLSKLLEKWTHDLLAPDSKTRSSVFDRIKRDKWRFIALPTEQYWVARVKPGNFERWVHKGKTDRWWTKRLPRTLGVGDCVFVWASSPQQEIAAVAEVHSVGRKPDQHGYFYYGLRFVTDLLSSPIKRTALERNPILNRSILLKHGPAQSLVRLTEEEGMELSRLLNLRHVASDDDYERDEEAIRSRTDIGTTKKAQLIQARRGQGIFKARVRQIEKHCRLTGINDPQHLRASHIKPWSKSTDAERLSGCNGLLLAPHVDHLFDQGFISFQDNGDILVSEQLPRSVLKAWGIVVPRNVGRFKFEQKSFLAYHRTHRFKK